MSGSFLAYKQELLLLMGLLCYCWRQSGTGLAVDCIFGEGYLGCSIGPEAPWRKCLQIGLLSTH